MSSSESAQAPSAPPGAPVVPEQPIVTNVDASQEYIKAQRTENIMKIVFGVIMAIVVIIVVLSIYSVLTQKCPSTSSDQYTPSLTCSSANVINQIGNFFGWIQSNIWVVILVPAGYIILQAAARIGISKFGGDTAITGKDVPIKPPTPEPPKPEPPKPGPDVHPDVHPVRSNLSTEEQLAEIQALAARASSLFDENLAIAVKQYEATQAIPVMRF